MDRFAQHARAAVRIGVRQRSQHGLIIGHGVTAGQAEHAIDKRGRNIGSTGIRPQNVADLRIVERGGQ